MKFCGRLMVAAFCIVQLAAISVATAAEVYPNRPIEFIVPWGAGGGSDQTARELSKLLQPELKVSVPVVNVPGGTGNAGNSASSENCPPADSARSRIR